jgi:hypothetical protein
MERPPEKKERNKWMKDKQGQNPAQKQSKWERQALLTH